MEHNKTSRIFRHELYKRFVRLSDWDEVIYNFSQKYNGSNQDIYKYINICINENIVRINGK